MNSYNVRSKQKLTNIVVFGIDRNDNGTDGRSDAMKILSLDRKNNTAKITSIQARHVNLHSRRYSKTLISLTMLTNTVGRT